MLRLLLICWDIPQNADTRDTTAIIRLASGDLKLLFPHVESMMDITKEEFEIIVLNQHMRSGE